MNQRGDTFGPQAVCEAPASCGPSSTDDQVRRLQLVQAAYAIATKTVMDVVPSTPDRDKAIRSLLDSKASAEAGVRCGRSVLTPDVLSRLLAPFRAQGRPIQAVWINALDFNDVLRTFSDILDLETRRDVLRKGIYGRVWGVTVCVSRRVPAGMAKIVLDGEEWSPPKGGEVPSEELVHIR